MENDWYSVLAQRAKEQYVTTGVRPKELPVSRSEKEMIHAAIKERSPHMPYMETIEIGVKFEPADERHDVIRLVVM